MSLSKRRDKRSKVNIMKGQDMIELGMNIQLIIVLIANIY